LIFPSQNTLQREAKKLKSKNILELTAHKSFTEAVSLRGDVHKTSVTRLGELISFGQLIA